MGIIDLVVLYGRIFYGDIGASCPYKNHMKPKGMLFFFPLPGDTTTKDLRKAFPSSSIRLARNTLAQTALALFSPEQISQVSRLRTENAPPCFYFNLLENIIESGIPSENETAGSRSLD